MSSVRDHPQSLVLSRAGVCGAWKAQGGARYFKRIIQEHLDSEWSGKSWFMIGEYYFDTVQDIEKSLQAYERASVDPNQAVTGFSLYKRVGVTSTPVSGK